MSEAETASVEDLWEQLAGRLHAFFRRRVATPEDAEDLLQECFLRVQRGIGGLADSQRVLGWVFQIASNLVSDYHRRQRVAEQLPGEVHADLEEESAAERVAGWLEPLIDALPAAYRDVLRAAEIDGHKYRDIAAQLGLSLAAVKSRVVRGRAMLRTKLEACCAFEFDRRGAISEWKRRGDACICDDEP